MIYVGVDLSDKFFDSCITDSLGDVLARSKFDFDNDGFCSLVKLIQEHQTANNDSESSNENSIEKLDECLIGLENPRSRLVDFLAGRGYTVVLTNPNAISSYRQSRKPSKAKSDAADAQLIADYAREHHKSLQRIQMPDETHTRTKPAPGRQR